MRKLLSYEEADQILQPLYPILVDAVNKAMIDYNACLEFTGEHLSIKQGLVPATKSILIWNFIINHVEVNFHDNPDVKPIVYKRVFGLLAFNSIFIRFKKIDKKGYSFNIETINSISFNSQGHLENFPEKPTLLKFGWITNKSNTWINDIRIICHQSDGGILWRIDVNEKLKTQYLFPPTEEEVSPEIDKLLRISANLKQKKKYGNT